MVVNWGHTAPRPLSRQPETAPCGRTWDRARAGRSVSLAPVTVFFDSVFARLLQTRALVRAPIWLYQHRLGWLLGHRMLMVEHTGRISGLPRFVCLEVVERRTPGVIVVASGFGRRAHWYQNLEAHPTCRVSIGARVGEPARARMMSDEDGEAALRRYRDKHPIVWRQLRGALEQAVHQRVDNLPMVELRLGQ